MKFLSKLLLAALGAIFSGVFLCNAMNNQLSAESFQLLCFAAQAQCARDVSGYQLQTGSIVQGHIGGMSANMQIDSRPGRTVRTTSVSCAGGVSFCTPTTEILYTDDLVKVIKKPGVRAGTDILIVPHEHICNTHALDQANAVHCQLLDRIWFVSQIVATYLPKGSTYTLMTNNGDHRQGVFHLHVHFKSKASLDEAALKACALKK